jgi:hypothetical protein
MKHQVKHTVKKSILKKRNVRNAKTVKNKLRKKRSLKIKVKPSVKKSIKRRKKIMSGGNTENITCVKNIGNGRYQINKTGRTTSPTNPQSANEDLSPSHIKKLQEEINAANKPRPDPPPKPDHQPQPRTKPATVENLEKLATEENLVNGGGEGGGE